MTAKQNISGNLLQQFAAVWNYYSPVNLPGTLFETPYTDDNPPPMMRPLLPVFGAVLALCVIIPVFLLGLFGRPAAAIAGGLLAPLLLEYLTGWAGLNALTDYIEARRNGVSQEEALPGFTEEDSSANNSLFTKITVYLLRAAMFAALCWAGAAGWIAVALAGAGLVRAEMSTGRTADGSEFFKTPADARNRHWLTGGIIFLLFAITGSWNILPAATAFAAVWGIGTYAVHLCAETPDGATDNAMNIFGYATELILLFLGVLIFAH